MFSRQQQPVLFIDIVMFSDTPVLNGTKCYILESDVFFLLLSYSESWALPEFTETLREHCSWVTSHSQISFDLVFDVAKNFYYFRF